MNEEKQQNTELLDRISDMEADELLSDETLNAVFDIEDNIEKIRKIQAIKKRAKELSCDREAAELIKAYTAEEKKIAEQYDRPKTKIPVELDEHGKIKNTIGNYESIIKNDPHFKGIRFNLLSNMPEIEENGKIRQWEDTDDAEARRYIESYYKIHSTAKYSDAMSVVFRSKAYHPIRQIVDTLIWDGKPRIEKFLTFALLAEDTPYTREVSRLIFAGGIHRAYNPGCKFEVVPVLMGKQGEGKSTAVRWLAFDDRFYTDIPTIDGKDGVESITGKWICELGELLALRRNKDTEAIKAFISRQTDHLRRAFERHALDNPRQCIFIGTTNSEQFLTDKTGNRRFFPVKVYSNGYEFFNREEEIKAYIKQCWAEAKVLYDKRQLPPYPDYSLINEIRAAQAAAVEDDYRVEMISSYLSDKDKTCVLDLWYNALKENEFTKPTSKDSREIGAIMQTFDEWERKTFRMYPYNNGGVVRGWKRKSLFIDNSGDIRF